MACCMCGSNRKYLAEVNIERATGNPLGTNRKYDCYRCSNCDYPTYVYHKTGNKVNTRSPKKTEKGNV